MRDVAARLRVNPETVRRMVARGDFPAPIKVGRVLRWRPEVVDAWIQEQEASA